MAGLLAWFARPSGRRFVGMAAATTTCGIFAVQYLPETFFLKNYYHDLVTMRKYGKPLPVTPKLESLVKEVMDDLSFSENKKNSVQPFMVFGFDIWHAGFLSSRFGVLVGLPINFTYTDKATVDKESIAINNEPVNWNREDSKQLIDSLILSNDAKKYAIARELLMADGSNLTIQSLTSSIIAGTCYGFTAHMNDSLNNWAKPRIMRMSFYSLMAAFFWGLYTMQKDALTRYTESGVDEHLAQLGPAYVKGGHEFYEKIASRNTALRTLLGPSGQNLYTANGNDVIWLRQKKLPISYRKQFFGDKLQTPEVPEVIATPNVQAA